LAVTLRWLAGGSYLDICFAFGVSTGSFYRSDGILWGTFAAIDNNLEIGFPLNDLVKLEQTSEGFAQSCQGRMKGCVMAMDGWVMKTRCPNAKEVTNQICFRNRKGVWGMVIFAGCDSRCSFLMFSAKYPGSTNDCIAWELTKVFQSIVVRKLLPHNITLYVTKQFRRVNLCYHHTEAETLDLGEIHLIFIFLQCNKVSREHLVFSLADGEFFGEH
jgi:hypothetical protein